MRKSKKFNLIIGKNNDGDFIFIDDVFDYGYDKYNFKNYTRKIREEKAKNRTYDEIKKQKIYHWSELEGYKRKFMGMTGYIIEILDDDEKERRDDCYYDEYNMRGIRKESVKSGNTELGLDERIEQIKRDDSYSGCSSLDGSFMNDVFDDINWNIIRDREKLGDYKRDYHSNCIGCGRIFDSEMLDNNYRERVDDENFELFKKLYKKYEK